MTTVDSHQHYWQLSRFDYGWIPPDSQALNQDRLPADLHPQMQAAGIDRSVLVHAANTPAEIPWLLSLCDEYPYIAGIVGYINPADRNAVETIHSCARDGRFKGVRLHLPFDSQDRELIDGGLRALAAHNLECDLLLGSHELPQALNLAKANPDLMFVLDHLAGSRIAQGDELAFASALQPFAPLSNTVMKVSGYLTASGDIPIATISSSLQPYLDVALDVFGPGRLMFGSDWPVCTQRGSYADAVNTLRLLTQALDPDEQAAIWGDTAARVYHLG